MKRYLYILTLGVLFSFASCVQEDITVGNGSYYPSSNSGIQIIGASEDFDVKQVGTRANDNGVSDSFISEMTMLIFKADGNMLAAYNANQEKLASSHINIRRSNPTFLIETSKYKGTGILASMEAGVTMKYYDNTATDIGACSIYIVANAYHLIGERLEAGKITTIAALNEALLDTNDKLNMPYNEQTGEYIGLPMIGCARNEDTGEVVTFDLSYHEGESNNNAVATIPLKKLYSKVCFSIQVNSKQLVTGQTPEFKLDDVEVFNVPAMVRMSHKDGDYISNIGENYLYRYVDDTQKTSFSFAQKKMMPSDVLCRHSSSEDTDDVVKFHFYMPEHKVTPYATEADYKYPDNLPEDNRQYFKPKLIKDTNNDGITESDKIATFVRIHGSYTDHNGNIHDIAYDIYLGQDNTDDFEVMRNQQLDNRLIITGITNHKDAYDGNDNTISIDHRVSMTNKGYNLSMEREAILDAHFEVRPLDIELQPGSTMKIVIPDTNDKTWIAMESDASADTSGKYVSNTHRKGVRKYFTEDLVSELNNLGEYTKGNGGTITVTNKTQQKEIHRIWFYVDENPNVYDKLLDQGKISSSPEGDYEVNDNVNETDKRYRVAKVNFYFAKEGEPDMTTPTTTINFQQWNLWRVWSAPNANGVRERYYDIEHEEEYLNNYASDLQYGQTKNGMPWGLGGVQLSDGVLAYWLEKVSHQTGDDIISAVINWIISGLDNLLNISNSSKSIFSKSGKEPYYDFYLSRDKFPTNKLDNSAVASDYARDYKGIEFNREIATTLKTNYPTQQVVHTNPQGNLAQIEKLNLTQAPSSAFAYCYHKNKRNSDGDVVEQKWFLPAIDEIEDIALGAYDEFDKVFQNEKYWSCQPAYERNKIIIEPSSDNVEYYKVNTMEGDFFNDNTSRARATSVYTNGTVYSNIESGLPNNLSSGKLTSRVNVKVSIGWTGIKVTQNGDPITQWLPSNVDYSDPIFANPNGEYRGNTPRTESCRIRAVYRSGTK